ncbi:MAG: dCMP deaminase family protein [Candidatus Helarchaeota archaeon]|nr:dCMP deaminase family protein [Candidatus Helarchaeota archaeon]
MSSEFNKWVFKIIGVISERSKCIRYKVGAVIIRDKTILSTGYNGPPRGLAHCCDEQIGCSIEKHKKTLNTLQSNTGFCRGAHAEANAIVQAAKNGIRIEGAIIYCNLSPCAHCLKLILNAGIKKIIYKEDYEDKLRDSLLNEAIEKNLIEIEKLTL